ncbi:MAG: DUF305 domain-containing protein [Hydrogenophaga sp.]|nr:DUF305 domain-containing protein [Hydrogenophaga sp.]
MNHQSTTKRFICVSVKALCAVSLTVLMSLSAHAQSTPSTGPATMPMAEMQLKTGKSPEMKAMAKQIIVAQKKEIAQFDKWLAKQK